MREYLKSTWVRVGLVLLVIGAAPLLTIIFAAAVGLWPDPNPNPVGAGLLFALTFWPAIIDRVVGVIRVRNRRAASPSVGAGRDGWGLARRERASEFCARVALVAP